MIILTSFGQVVLCHAGGPSNWEIILLRKLQAVLDANPGSETHRTQVIHSFLFKTLAAVSRLPHLELRFMVDKPEMEDGDRREEHQYPVKCLAGG
jgi:hypothetical protein